MDKGINTEPKKGKTKQKIVQAAIKCFGKTGVEQTKLIDIAAEAGINHSLVLYHYKTFDEIAYAAIGTLVQEYFEALHKFEGQTISDPKLHLNSYILTHFLLAKKSRTRFSVWLHFYYKASLDDKYRKLLQLIRLNSMNRVKMILAQYFEQETVQLSAKKLDDAVMFVLGIISGNVILALTGENSALETYGKMTVNTVNNYLESLFGNANFSH